jgi:phenylacetic acid degradation operon negative regulatory protein
MPCSLLDAGWKNNSPNSGAYALEFGHHLFSMKPKTEELLYFLLWTCEGLVRPTWRNVSSSFESWAYRNGLLRQIKRLRQAKLLELREDSDDWVCRLTAQGRLHVLGGRDPEQHWNRTWDGKWRLVLFDVPLGRDTHRNRLRRYLRNKGFGYLQNSVWISPDSLADERAILEGGKVTVESLILLEARPVGGESDEQIVEGAWDFTAINLRYSKCMDVLRLRPTQPIRTGNEAKTLRQWAERERSAWLHAVSHDPLLPAELLPAKYAGRTTWQARVQAMTELGRQLEAFSP